MAAGKGEGVPLLAIDPYGGTTATVPPTAMRAFCENMDRLGVADDVQLFWGKSEEAARSRTQIFATARQRLGRGDLRAGAVTRGEAVLFPGSGEDAAQVRHRVFRVDEASRPDPAGDAAADASPPVIGLLFVDGRHDRVSVLQDIDLWEPHVGVGGTVVFHDAFFRRGVTRALFERHLVNRDFRYERSLVNTSIFRRTEPLGAGAALVSGLRMTTRTAHFARNMATTVGVRRDWKWLQRRLPPAPDFEY